MDRGRRDMQGVGVSFLRQEPFLNNSYGQPLSRISDLQERDAIKHLESPLGSLGVAKTGFIHDQQRGYEVKISPSTIPPVQRDLLMSCRNDIPTGSGCEIADHGGLYVDLGLH